MSEGTESTGHESLITREHVNPILGLFQFVDIFAFLPVPKDESVSTKQSLLGTLIFFLIFGSYILIDFISFIVNNPPKQQVSRISLDEQTYQLPNIALAFMEGDLNN